PPWRGAGSSAGRRPRSSSCRRGVPRTPASGWRAPRPTWASAQRCRGAAPISRWFPGGSPSQRSFPFPCGWFLVFGRFHAAPPAGVGTIAQQDVLAQLVLLRDQIGFFLRGFELGAQGDDLRVERRALARQLALAAFDLLAAQHLGRLLARFLRGA